MFEWKRNSGGPIPASKMSGNTGCGVLKFQPKLGELSPRHVPLVPAQAEELVGRGHAQGHALLIHNHDFIGQNVPVARALRSAVRLKNEAWSLRPGNEQLPIRQTEIE